MKTQNLQRARFLTVLMLLALALTGCGSKYKDAANLIGGMAGESGGTAQGLSFAQLSNPLSGNESSSGGQTQGFSAKLRESARGLIWLARFKAEAQLLTAPISCTEATIPLEDGYSCMQSCPADNQIKMSCSIPEGKSTTCDGTQYTFSAGAFAFTMDFTNLNPYGGASLGSFSLSFEFGANVDGGSFGGERLDCRIGMTFDYAKLMTGQSAASLSCGSDYSCSYDGEPIDCEDIQEEYSESPNTCN
ncbi:MAG: hypothetical protein NDJ89_09805 [Oligoflexia bacterium]|nr:hypothetical protein [Oligoflexia bacterium]